MTTAPQTVNDYVRLAREAIASGDLAKASTYTDQAKALKSVEAIVPPSPGRLTFPDTAHATIDTTAQDVAVKTWYHNRYGALDDGMAQVGQELYGADFRKVAWAKTADFVRYVRTGQADPQLHRMVLFSANQLAEYVLGGASVAEIKATQVEAQDQLGGYLVPEDIRDKLVTRLQGAVVMRRMNAALSTGRDRVSMPVATGGDDRYPGSARATWVDESPTGAQSETNATFGQVNIPVHTLMANVPISKNLLEDAVGALGIVGILEAQLQAAFQVVEDEAFLIGNGAARPLGILIDATTGGPRVLAYGSMATVNSGAATALTGDAFRNTPYAIAAQYRDQGCAWLFSRGTARVIKTLKAGDGTYLWSGRSDTPQLAQGQPQSLEGFPINETEVLAAPTTNSGTTYTANVYPVIFMAKNSYQIVDRIGMDVMRYDDSTTAVTNSIRLVARRRVGGQPINPWAIAVMKVSA